MEQASLIKHITVDLYRGVGLLVNGVEAEAPPDFNEPDEGQISLDATFKTPDGDITLIFIQGTWSCEEVPNKGNPVTLTCADSSEIELTTTRVEVLFEQGEKQVPWGEGERTIDETHLYFTAERA